MTVRDLFDIIKTITPAVRHFNHGGVEKFNKKYKMIINASNVRLMNLIPEFYEMDGETPKVVEGKFVYKQGKTEEEYIERQNKILNQVV